MYRRSSSQFAPAALAALFTFTLISCATTPDRPVVVLPNGFYLTPNAQEQSQLIKRGGATVLPGPIAAYATSGDIVAGALGEAPTAGRLYSDQPYTGGPDTKYFILDTDSGKVDSNLDATQWHQRLKELGVPSNLEIYPPLPWNNNE
jgi:hypothetical protein